MFSVTLAELSGKLERRYILLESLSSGILPYQVLQRPSRGDINEILSTAERETPCIANLHWKKQPVLTAAGTGCQIYC